MKKLFYSLVIFTMSSCSSQESPKTYFDIADECAHKSNLLMEKKGFQPYCCGGSYRGTFRSTIYSYYTKQYRFTDVADARALLIENALQFAESFNNEKRIRMYLHNFPFELKNIELSIHFHDDKDIKLYPPYITSVSNRSGTIVYSQYDPIEKSTVLHKESVDEALKLYNEHKINIQKE